MSIDERLLPILKQRLSYTDQQFQEFFNNPITESVIGKAREIAMTILVLTVLSLMVVIANFV